MDVIIAIKRDFLPDHDNEKILHTLFNYRL